jgi:hypothetical protein
VAQALSVVADLRPVRVTRNGNTRTLAIPVEVVEAAHIEVGDVFRLAEVTADTLTYRRVDPAGPRGELRGTGADRVLELPRGAGMSVGPDPSPVPPLDWDF